MSEGSKPRLVGINHVAIEVGDIDEALEWYGRLFSFTLRGKGERNAFIDMGDQFINMTLVSGPQRPEVERRHIGLVVDDRSRIIELAQAAGARMVEGPFLDFLDPWGNRLEIIEYSNIQFTKAPNVMRGMGLTLDKNAKAKSELADKGMAEEFGTVKLSLIVRGQHPPGNTAQHLHDDLELVRCADRLGFDGIVKGSHYSTHPFESVQQLPFLAYCAAIAPRLRIICGLVLVPLHKPLDLAEQLATLDLLCGGKLVFGAGIGYRDVEFKAFGVPRGQLGARFEECLTAIRRLWTEDFVTMKGAGFELDQATCTVKPLQQPTPPIWIGANADIAIRRAARIGDCWYINPHNTLATIERQMQLYKRTLEECGRPFPTEVPMRREVFVAPTRSEAIRRAQPYLEEKYKAYRAWGQDKVMPEGDDFDHSFDELLEDRFLFGSPEEVADQLNRLNARLGVNHLVASIHWPGMPNSLALEQLHLLAEKVRPLLRPTT